MNAPTGYTVEHSFEIMLLDDEPSVVAALTLLLKALKFRVKGFTSPIQALEHLASGASVNLFLCDLRMPEMNGLQVLERSRATRPDVPFILISAHAGPDEVEQALDLGATGFLAKPFSPDQLREAIAELNPTPELASPARE